MTADPPSRVADLVAAALRDAGVRLAFGMPGGEIMTFVDALGRAGIRFVLTRTETAAAIAAAAAGLLEGGAPGLLVTTLGPGLANAANGIADCAQERMPLIAVTGVVDRPLRSRFTHQVIDHGALARACGAKASFEIAGPEDAAAVVARAVRLACQAPPGPVHLDLAPAVAAQAAAPPPRVGAMSRAVAAGSAGDAAGLDTIAAALARARRPLLVAGFGLARSGAPAAVATAAFVARYGMPVITTYKAKGVLDEEHPLALGAGGLSPLADATLLPLAGAADLVLLAGVDPIEWRAGWMDAFAAASAVIAIGEEMPDQGMVRPTAVHRAVPAAALAALADRPTSGGAGPARWPEGEPARARTALAAAFGPHEPWGPQAVVAILNAALPPEAVVTVDSGAHRILLSQQWRARRPLAVLQSAGWCTMGAALPLAIGAALADPARPVVAALGDGGFEMTLGELGTLRDQHLRVIVVVVQDASLALIALKQAQAGLPPDGTTLGRTDIAAVARGFGGHGVTVRDRTALARAVAAALDAETFSVIACEVEASAYVGRI